MEIVTAIIFNQTTSQTAYFKMMLRYTMIPETML